MGSLFSSKSSNQQLTSQPVTSASGQAAQTGYSVHGDSSGTGSTAITLGNAAKIDASTKTTVSGTNAGNTGKITTGGNDASGKGAKIFNVNLGPPSTGTGNLGAIQPKGAAVPAAGDKSSSSSVFSNVEAGGVGLSGTGNKLTTNTTNTTNFTATDLGAVNAGLEAAKAAAESAAQVNLQALTRVSDLAAAQSSSNAAALEKITGLASTVNTNSQPADVTTQKNSLATLGIIGAILLAGFFIFSKGKKA